MQNLIVKYLVGALVLQLHHFASDSESFIELLLTVKLIEND